MLGETSWIYLTNLPFIIKYNSMRRGSDEQRSSPWRSSTARRVTLAVRSSISSLSRPPHAQFSQESDDELTRQNADHSITEYPAQNIDQAMRSLYSTDLKQTPWTQLQNPQRRTAPSTSFVPKQDFDWMLDVPHCAASEIVSESEEWLVELENGGNRRLRELEKYIARWEQGLQSTFEFESSESEDTADQESIRSSDSLPDDDFGDFQSASDGPMPTETDLRTTVLVDQAESLLMKNHVQQDTPDSKSPLTPDLLERSEQVVAEHLDKISLQLDRRDTGTFTNDSKSSQSRELHGDGDVSLSQIQDADGTHDQLPSHIALPSPVPASLPVVARGIHDRPISLKLPWNDYSTPEGRFLRRRQQLFFIENNEVLGLKQHEDDSSNDEIALAAEDQDRCIRRLQEEFNLPGYYFTNPDVDDGIKILGSLPWHNLMALYSKSEGITANSDIEVWDEYMTSQLSDLDAALEEVQKNSLQHVQPHEAEIRRANILVHDLDQNLRLAEMYWERCREALEVARGDEIEGTGLAGSMMLLEMFDERENYRKLDSLLQEITNAEALLDDLYDGINALSFQHGCGLEEYEAIIKKVESLRKNLSTDRLLRVTALDLTRSRLENIGLQFWKRLETLCQSDVVRLCRRAELDWVGHERLVEACLDVGRRYGAALPDGTNLSAWWSTQINKAFHYEAERSLTVALIDPAYDVVHSDFSKDLDQLGDEIDLDWGDRHKLRNLTHNLTTIRFDFEASIVNYLPGVMRKLCESLRTILVAYLDLARWLASLNDDSSYRGHSRVAAFGSLSDEIIAIKQQIWNHCENVIVRCLEEYLASNVRQTLFDCTEHYVDETVWLKELKSLCIVYALVDRFISQKQSFFGSAEFVDDIATLAEQKNVLVERLGDVFRRHLRTVHVEAMNTSGRKLANESWILQSFNDSTARKPSDTSSRKVGITITHALEAGFRFYEAKFTLLTALHGLDFSIIEKESSKGTSSQPFEKFDELCVEHISSVKPRSFPSVTLDSGSPFLRHLEDEIDDQGSLSRIAPDYVANDLVQWLARLLAVMKCFPPVAEDVSAVVANLCDLYTTTSLRICAGSAQNEKYLLGISTPNSFYEERDENQQWNVFSGVSGGNNTSIFDSFRKGRRNSKYSLHMRSLPSTLDAEICEPLLSDAVEINCLRSFVTRGQESLRDVVNLDKVDTWMRNSDEDQPSHRDLDEEVCEACRLLEKRASSSLGLYAAAYLTIIFYEIANNYLINCPIGNRFVSNLDSLQRYASAFFDVAPALVRLSTQVACQRAMKGVEIVAKMTCNEAVWEESKLNEEPNDYVELLCEKCALFWGFLSTSGKLPDKAIASIWSGLLTAAYLSMLEGFSRISFCSTEGRALMALDLASFTSGVRPQSIKERLDRRSFSAKDALFPSDLSRGMAYVDTYIKVFYYPEKDALEWIRKNYKRYRLNHTLALRIATKQDGASRLWKEELADLYGHADKNH